MARLKADSARNENGSLPEIIWKNGRSWGAASKWVEHLAVVDQLRMHSIHCLMQALRRYAEFLESQGIPWTHFPKEGADAVRIYEKHLVGSADISHYAAGRILHSVFKFYKFAKQRGLVKAEPRRDILTKFRPPVLERRSKPKAAPKLRVNKGR